MPPNLDWCLRTLVDFKGPVICCGVLSSSLWRLGSYRCSALQFQAVTLNSYRYRYRVRVTADPNLSIILSLIPCISPLHRGYLVIIGSSFWVEDELDTLRSATRVYRFKNNSPCKAPGIYAVTWIRNNLQRWGPALTIGTNDGRRRRFKSHQTLLLAQLQALDIGNGPGKSFMHDTKRLTQDDALFVGHVSRHLGSPCPNAGSSIIEAPICDTWIATYS